MPPGALAVSKCPLRTIKEIQFGLLSPEEIKAMSVVHIIYPETMDEQKQKPRDQGLNDPRLGTIDRMYSCATCKEDIQVCPGHFGHIELHTPVFHVGFVVKIKKLLETVCHTCGMIKADFVSLPDEDFAFTCESLSANCNIRTIQTGPRQPRPRMRRSVSTRSGACRAPRTSACRT
jgi:DNA-directed RNA polymerase II subunit RPB1